MFTAAFVKWISGWLDPATSAVFGQSLHNAIGRERGTPAWQLAVQTLPSFAWECMDYATVLLEASFIIAMFSRQAFKTVCCSTACMFHLGVAMLMRITFLP